MVHSRWPLHMVEEQMHIAQAQSDWLPGVMRMHKRDVQVMFVIGGWGRCASCFAWRMIYERNLQARKWLSRQIKNRKC